MKPTLNSPCFLPKTAQKRLEHRAAYHQIWTIFFLHAFCLELEGRLIVQETEWFSWPPRASCFPLPLPQHSVWEVRDPFGFGGFSAAQAWCGGFWVSVQWQVKIKSRRIPLGDTFLLVIAELCQLLCGQPSRLLCAGTSIDSAEPKGRHEKFRRSLTWSMATPQIDRCISYLTHLHSLPGIPILGQQCKLKHLNPACFCWAFPSTI